MLGSIRKVFCHRLFVVFKDRISRCSQGKVSVYMFLGAVTSNNHSGHLQLTVTLVQSLTVFDSPTLVPAKRKQWKPLWIRWCKNLKLKKIQCSHWLYFSPHWPVTCEQPLLSSRCAAICTWLQQCGLGRRKTGSWGLIKLVLNKVGSSSQ